MSTSKRILVFAALTAVQVSIAVVYNLAQSNGKYDFSPASALVIAEIFKATLSTVFLIQASEEITIHAKLTSVVSTIRGTSHLFRLHVLLLALSYAVNNQLGFAVFLVADAASITLVKSGSSFVSAIILWIVVRRQISSLQWAAIFVQVTGLVVALYDPCKEASILPGSAYLLLGIHVIISCINGVWNEHLVKNYAFSLHAQNLLLYLCGAAFNMLFYLVVPGSWLGSDDTTTFFHGYTLTAYLVVFLNSIIGIVIVAVYKHADVLVKTFGLACATGILYFINYILFGKSLSIVGGAGALSVFIASYVYFNGNQASSKAEDQVIVEERPPSTHSSNGFGRKHIFILIAVLISVVTIVLMLGVSVPFAAPNEALSIAPGVASVSPCERCLNMSGMGYCQNFGCVAGTRDSNPICPPELWHWNICNSTARERTYFNDMLVIIYFNSDRPERLPLLRGWNQVFPNLIFTGVLSIDYKRNSDVFECKDGGNLLWYRCVAKIMAAYPEYDGYLAFHFDVAINYWNYEKISRDKIWQSWGRPTPPSTWWWPQYMATLQSIEKRFNETNILQQVQRRMGSTDIRLQGWSDVLYVPRRFMSAWLTWANFFSEYALFHEIANPLIAHLIAEEADIVNTVSPGMNHMADNQKSWNPTFLSHHRVDFTLDDQFLTKNIWNASHSWSWTGSLRVPRLTYPVRKPKGTPKE